MNSFLLVVMVTLKHFIICTDPQSLLPTASIKHRNILFCNCNFKSGLILKLRKHLRCFPKVSSFFILPAQMCPTLTVTSENCQILAMQNMSFCKYQGILLYPAYFLQEKIISHAKYDFLCVLYLSLEPCEEIMFFPSVS